MSAPLSSRALRTLRRLARPALPIAQVAVTESHLVSQINQTLKVDQRLVSPTYLTLFRGGEGLSPALRRRFRRSLRNIPSRLNLPIAANVTIRYGGRAIQERRFRSSSFESLRSLLRGERIRREVCLVSTDSKSQSVSAQCLSSFLKERSSSFSNEIGRGSLFATGANSSVTIGPSSRLLFVALPSLRDDSVTQLKAYSNSTRLFRPSAIQNLVGTEIAPISKSLLPTLNNRATAPLIPICTIATKVGRSSASTLRAPHFSILSSLSFLVHRSTSLIL